MSGKVIELEPDESLVVRASTRIGREGFPTHIIRYRPELGTELPYLVAHECGHLIRFYEAPEDCRVLPYSSQSHRSRVAGELKRDVEKLVKKGVPRSMLTGLLGLWHDGLVRQVTNCPADMRIERWLWEGYPQLREYQEYGLREQLEDNQQVLKPEVEAFTPCKVYYASNTMNAAFGHYIGLLVDDESLAEPYRLTVYERTGRALAETLWSGKDRGYPSDTEETDRWAHIFGIEKWFGWRPLER